MGGIGIRSLLGYSGYGYVEMTDADTKFLPTIGWGEVFCVFNKGNRGEFSTLRRGHIVEVVGVADSTSVAVVLQDCSAVKS